MENKNFLKRVGALGFPLFDPEEDYNANLTLADMVKSKDLRLWEGFPVVLANSAEKGLFDYDKLNQHLKKPLDRSRLVSLLMMSFALYKFFNLRFSWADKVYKLLAVKGKKEYADFRKRFKNDKDLDIAKCEVSPQRLKDVFSNYFLNQAQAKLNELLSVKDELSLEYSLSQVFSAKQKELFLKKLRREKMTKTEKEYFSRAVKKKVLALANPELHRLAQKLLE